MQFKYFLYWTAVGCAGCQMLLALYARFYGGIAEQIQGAPLAPAESELAVVQALNYAMPVGIGCLLFLCYTWKINKVGGFALVFALGLQAAANMSVNLSLIPPKGMTLPLVSSGGSSLLGSALTLALALALTRKRFRS